MSRLRDGEPCGHPGCLNHISHPCEGCGRIGGRSHPVDILHDAAIEMSKATFYPIDEQSFEALRNFCDEPTPPTPTRTPATPPAK